MSTDPDDAAELAAAQAELLAAALVADPNPDDDPPSGVGRPAPYDVAGFRHG
jgi:hypothetical protein